MAPVIPVPWVVGRREWQPGSVVDAHGNTEDGWGEPVAVQVHAVSPRLSDEPSEARRHVVIEGLTVYAPAGTVVGEHDRIVWPFAVRDGAPVVVGDEYEVDGPVSDWTKGPWRNPVAGVVWNMTRVEG